jgi:O-methyltransferase involved in polyketide biosynthesis
VSLGCGFDCRPYRLAHGNWYEIDQEPIIRLKESILPVSQCHNPLERIIGNITSVGFKEVLRSLPLNNPIFVIEGVLNYLDENEVQDLLITIKIEYPNCTIICDLMSKLFYSKYAKDFVSALASVDLSYRFLRNDYAHYLQNVGYSTVEALSILDLSIKAGLFSVPKVFRKLFLRKLAEGYTLYILKPND